MSSSRHPIILQLFILLAFLSLGSMVAADTFVFPHLLEYQALLTDPAGDPVPDGTFPIHFRLFDSSSDGVEVWAEFHSAVSTNRGMMTVSLGSVTGIPMDSLTGAGGSRVLYLEIQIEGEPPMSPRTRIGGALFAAVATRIDGDISTGEGLLVMTDSLGDTTIVWDASAARGIIKEMHPPHGTSFEAGRITMTDSLGDTTMVFRSERGNGAHLYPPGQTTIEPGRIAMTELGSSGEDGFKIDFDENNDGIVDGYALSMISHDILKPVIQNMRAVAPSGDSSEVETKVIADAVRFTLVTVDGSSGDTSQVNLLVNTSGASLRFNKTDMVDDEELLELSVKDDSVLFRCLSKADAKRALEVLTTSSSVSLTLIDSTLNDSGLIGMSIVNGAPEIRMAEDRDNGDGTASKFEFTMMPDRMEFTKGSADPGGGGGTTSLGLDEVLMLDVNGDTAFSVKSQNDGVVHSATWTQTSGPYKFSTQTSNSEGSSTMGLSKADAGKALNAFVSASSVALTLIDSTLNDSGLIGMSIVNGAPELRMAEDRDNGDGTTSRFEFTVLPDRIELAKTAPGGGSLTQAVTLDMEKFVRASIDPADSDSTFVLNFANEEMSLRSSGGPGIAPSRVEIADLDADGTLDLRVDGNVTVGTSTATEKLTVIGNICATGLIGPCSDERFKKDISTLENSLETLTKLRGVAFKYRADEFPNKEFSEALQVGFIAQEIKDVLPSVVSKGADGYYIVDYGKLTPVLVEAMKEQQQQIDSQQKQIDELKKLVQQLVNNSNLSESTFGMK